MILDPITIARLIDPLSPAEMDELLAFTAGYEDRAFCARTSEWLIRRFPAAAGQN